MAPVLQRWAGSCLCLGKGSGAAHHPPEPGWLQPQHSHARRDSIKGDGLTGRPTQNLAQTPGSRQHRSIDTSPSATYQRLRAFIAEGMRMSPIDQLLMLLELLGHGVAWQEAAPPRRRTWPGEEVFAHRSPISGSVKVRVELACDQELNSWGWLCATRTAHQPPSELSLNHLVQLVSQGWNALGNNLPDGVVFQAEIGMRQNIAEASNASPGHLGVPLADRRRDLLCRFTKNLQVAQYGVNHHLVSKKVLPGEPLAVSEHFGAAQLHVLEEQRPITGTPPLRQEQRPPARSAAAVQGEVRGASPGPPER